MKKLHAGGEVDSWCTKCRLFLNHRIIAMVGSKPVRVECSTCGSHHNFRARPPGVKETGNVRAPVTTSSAPRAARASGPTRAAVAEMAREQAWEKAIAGRSLSDFRPYKLSATFAAGDLVRHSRFGDGVVTRVIDAGKVEILFKGEARTLAQGVAD
jgi:hypothetical protein